MFEVILHQYDLSQGMAKQMSQQLVGKYFEGIWHTGICVYNKEYYYGGGVSYDLPAQTPFGKPTKVISLGFTEITQDIFMEFLSANKDEWNEQKYHVFEHNCNHFTNAAADFLLGDGIPPEIINQPKEFLGTPLGNMLAPMMQGMQDNLKLQSNTVFNNQTGGTNPVRQQAPPGIYGGQGGAGAGAGMPAMGGMGGGGGGGMPAGLPAGLPPNIQNMLGNMNPAQMNSLMQRFGGGMNLGGAGGAAGGAPMSTAPQVGQLFQVTSYAQLQILLKNSPGVLLDFWSPRCPPCMRIKPAFEQMAVNNKNPNIVLAAVNTQQVKDCSQPYGVSGIPNFIAFLNGQQIANFKGANMAKLTQTLQELEAKVPMGKAVVGASSHDQIAFKQFKPTHLAPQGFIAQTNFDKMKQFIVKFASSEQVKKEVGEVEAFKKWMVTFDLETISNEAIDDLIAIVESAEEKSKIAMVDLLRLLLQYDDQAYHILKHHWDSFDSTIIQYLQCMDIKDPNNKVIHNYHLVSLKMFGNIYQTPSGLDFIGDNQASKSLLQFCEFSLGSQNPKTVFTAAVVIFNHMLTYSRDLKNLNASCQSILMSIIENIEHVNDIDALNAVILAETRIIYKNPEMTHYVAQNIRDKFIGTHKFVAGSKIADKSVKESIQDLLSLIGE